MEKRDLYNENSEVTSKTYFKGEPIPVGYYPMVVMICIQNSKGEFLMQKRVPSKGGDWGVTGGHPKSGETPYEGMITEVREELGFFHKAVTALIVIKCITWKATMTSPISKFKKKNSPKLSGFQLKH